MSIGSDPALRFIQGEKPLADLAERYLRAMLARERNRASDLVMELVDGGVGIREVYLHVFQPVQYEIGWLWQNGKISVGQEHYCTNATQLIMSTLYPRLFSGKSSNKRLLAACVQGELHELGLRMLSDFFEMDGWNTDFFGANTPRESVVSAFDEIKADVIAIGVTMHNHLEEADKLIRAIREPASRKNVPVLVGGYTFLAVDSMWQKLGADGTAGNAQEAMDLVARLTNSGGNHD